MGKIIDIFGGFRIFVQSQLLWLDPIAASVMGNGEA